MKRGRENPNWRHGYTTYLQLRAAVLAYLGSRCVRCGYSDPRALQIDHVHGGGNRERKALRSNTWKWYLKILSGAPGYQLLCANCNWVKKYEQNERSNQYAN